MEPFQAPLVTPRLHLRRLEARDDGQFWRLRTDPVVRQWLEGELWPSVDHAREQRLKLQAGIEAGKCCFWALSATPAGPLWGTVCLWNFTPDRSDCELGFELFASRQGKGLMTEAVDAVLRWAWERLPLQSVSALTHGDNRAARRLLERQGFVVGPVPPSWELTDSEARSHVYYRLDREVTAPR